MKIQFLELLAHYNNNLYQNYKVRLEDGTLAVLKFYLYEYSDENNEHKLLPYFQTHPSFEGVRHLFPKLIHCITRGDNEVIEVIEKNDEVSYSFTINDEVIRIPLDNNAFFVFPEPVYQILIHEYFEGEYLDKIPRNNIDVDKLRKDITEHIHILHSRGLILGHLFPNCVILYNNRFMLTDYMRTFSINRKPFPPMRYMTEYTDEVPTIKEDFELLERCIEKVA